LAEFAWRAPRAEDRYARAATSTKFAFGIA
jgi:hypothetical protein